MELTLIPLKPGDIYVMPLADERGAMVILINSISAKKNLLNYDLYWSERNLPVESQTGKVACISFMWEVLQTGSKAIIRG